MREIFLSFLLREIFLLKNDLYTCCLSMFAKTILLLKLLFKVINL